MVAALQQAFDECRNVFDCLPAFGQFANLKDMDLARPDFELHFNPVGLGLGRYANAIVADHLVLADLNEQRRDTRVIAEDQPRPSSIRW